jgi:hypothetical protein
MSQILRFAAPPPSRPETVSREKQYQTTLRQAPAGNDVELFPMNAQPNAPSRRWMAGSR